MVELRAAFDTAYPVFQQGRPFWHEATFEQWLRHCPAFARLPSWLPPDLSAPAFTGQEDLETVWSSYKDHGYGQFFYALGRTIAPQSCVEIGVLQGYSLLCMGAALRDNGAGTIVGFDLFERYPYHHDTFARVAQRIADNQLCPWVSVEYADAYTVHERFQQIDYLHVDISNDGDTYRRIFALWADKVRQVMVFEGGGPARDQVGWMLRYNKPPIGLALAELRTAYPEWQITTFPLFPSLTIAARRTITGGIHERRTDP
jgi:hypothetical protein